MISPDKMYYVKEETPLTYFKVLKVLMVIWIISSIIQMVGAPNVMSIVEHAVVVVLSIGALANFSDMKWTGVKFVYALLAFLTIDNLGGAIIFGSMGYDISQPLATGIGDGLLLYATHVYFQKRRPLFTPFDKEKSAVKTPGTDGAAAPKNLQNRKPANSAAANDIDKLITQAFESAQGMPDSDKMLYELEFHFMPELFFADPEKYMTAFSNKAAIAILFKKLTNISWPEKDFSVNHAELSQGVYALILGLPEPASIPLCKSIVAIYNSVHPERSRYYTIEKSFVGYCLCAVKDNGTHSNYGMCSGETGYEDAIANYTRTHSNEADIPF